MLTFKEFYSSSHKVAKQISTDVNARNDSNRNKIANRMDNQRHMLQQHLMHRTVNKEIKKLGNGN